jgi:hypothetical protein
VLQLQSLAAQPLQLLRDLHHADVIAVVCDSVVIAGLSNQHPVTWTDPPLQGLDALHKQRQLTTTLPAVDINRRTNNNAEQIVPKV